MLTNQLDLNLLTVLKQLLEEKHVSNTALTLGLSQPSVSRSLNKLRKLFDDPLLARINGSYQLTPKAESIKNELDTILSQIDVLLHKQHFEPQNSKAVIKLFGLAPQMNQLISCFISEFQSQAPNMTLDIDTLAKPHFSALLKGDVHFVVSGHHPSPSSEESLYKLPLFQRSFMIVMSKSHPLANQKLTIDNLKQCRFGQISMQGEKDISIAPCFDSLGIDVQVPVLLKDIYSIGTIAEKTNTVFYLPNNLAEDLCQRHEIVAQPAPAELDIGLTQVYLYWHHRYHHDPMCQWFRSLIKSQLCTN